MGETPAGGEALGHRNARLLVAIGDEKRRRATVAALTLDGYAFVSQPADGDGNALVIVAESNALDRRWLEGPRRPRLVRLDRSTADDAADDWIPSGATEAELRHRVKLNAELAVLRNHVAGLAQTPEAVKKRIARLEQGLNLLQEAQRHLERQLAEVRQRDAKRDGGLQPAAVLHELKTPLNAISGFAEIMRMEAYGPLGADKYREYVETIHEASVHLASVVNDLMEIYSLEAGQTRVFPAKTDLRRTVLAVTRLLSHQAEQAGVNVVADIDSRIPPLETDEGRVRQVLINLVGNAIKFTRTGGQVTIHIASEPATQALSLKVTDTGVGIAPERLPGVAQPYSRGQPGPDAPEGSGLGLSIAKFMVEKLGGRMGIDSTVGSGTEVTVTLPIRWSHKAPPTTH
ncbi:MAG: HAMP domain-containing histidine kinase [Alphaproteobacteria bacterium]|nr:HAMP domain-containing histidine kinase [Alphaproteobacteria bacterium]